MRGARPYEISYDQRMEFQAAARSYLVKLSRQRSTTLLE